MKRSLAYLVIALCAALFLGATGWLVSTRIEEGNVYPPASSLRTDPLGAMMLWESLAALPGLTVERDHSPVTRLPHGKNTTYLHLGGLAVDWSYLNDTEEQALEQFLVQGGRLVVTLLPNSSRSLEDREKKPKPSPSPAPEESPSPSPTPDSEEKRVSMKKKWGLSLDSVKPAREDISATRTAELPGLPASLPWHSSIVLKNPGPAWTVIYSRDGHPVIAEMKRGSGTIVFLTDSYLLSNEALVRDRQSALLVWLVGGRSRVVFDEAHHGIVDSPGLASMARRYGLTGAAFAFLALVGLFLWKNSSSLAPRQKSKVSSDEPVAGRPSFAGFVAMLRRNIPPAQLFATCWDEWEKTFSRSRRFSERRKRAAVAIVNAESSRPAKERNSVDAYRRVHHILHHHSAEP